MTEKDSGPFPVNRAPLEADEMVVATSRGIFAVSPPGTGVRRRVFVSGADCSSCPCYGSSTVAVRVCFWEKRFYVFAAAVVLSSQMIFFLSSPIISMITADFYHPG